MIPPLTRIQIMPANSPASSGFVERASLPPRSLPTCTSRHADCCLSSKCHEGLEVIGCLPFSPSHPKIQKAAMRWCVFFRYYHPKVSTQVISSRFWRNQPSSYKSSRLCACHIHKTQVRLEDRFKDEVPASLRNKSSLLVAGEEASEDCILDHRDVLEDLLAETENGSVEASLKERLKESFEKSHSSLLLESSVGNFRKQEMDMNHWWTELNDLFSPRLQSILLLNVLTLLYGSNVSVIKQSQMMLDPATFSASRFAIACMAFSPFLWQIVKFKHLRSAGLELGVLASIGYLTQCVGLVTTEAAHSSFISTFTVIVVPLLSGMLGFRIPKITWAAAAVSLLGVTLLESGGAQASVGDLWSFSSAIFFGIHMLRTEHYSRNLPADASMPILSLQLFVIALLSTLWSFCSSAGLRAFVLNHEAMNGTSFLEGMATLPWLSLLYTGLISTAFPLWIELVSMRNVSATEAAIIYTLEPLWGAGFAWSFLGERWGPGGWMGAFLILGGSLTVQIFGRVEETWPENVIDGRDIGKHNRDDFLCRETPFQNLEMSSQDIPAQKIAGCHRLARSKLRDKKF